MRTCQSIYKGKTTIGLLCQSTPEGEKRRRRNRDGGVRMERDWFVTSEYSGGGEEEEEK